MCKNIPYFVEGSLQGTEWAIICKVFTIQPGTTEDLDKNGGHYYYQYKQN